MKLKNNHLSQILIKLLYTYTKITFIYKLYAHMNLNFTYKDNIYLDKKFKLY